MQIEETTTRHSSYAGVTDRQGWQAGRVVLGCLIATLATCSARGHTTDARNQVLSVEVGVLLTESTAKPANLIDGPSFLDEQRKINITTSFLKTA
jgi:hypothetical protein